MKALKDQTYADALQPDKMQADVIGYLEWLADPDGLAGDTAKIRALAGLP
jgi:cytochrome c1